MTMNITETIAITFQLSRFEKDFLAIGRVLLVGLMCYFIVLYAMYGVLLILYYKNTKIQIFRQIVITSDAMGKKIICDE